MRSLTTTPPRSPLLLPLFCSSLLLLPLFCSSLLPPTVVGKKELAAHDVVLSIHRIDRRRYELVDPYDLEVIIVQLYLVDDWVGAGEALLAMACGTSPLSTGEGWQGHHHSFRTHQ